MDFTDLGPLLGGSAVFGALLLAVIRYLASDTPYRDLIGELRADNAELRAQVDALRKQLEEMRETARVNDQRAQAREAELLAEIRRLQQMIAPQPPWPAPGGPR